MADDFGLKIGLEGEKEFKRALTEINQSFKVLGSEMKLVSSQFDKNDNSVEALTARNQVLNREIDEQKKKIETLRSALNNASNSFGENDKRTKNWQIQLNNAEAALNDMERELKQNEKSLKNTGGEFSDAGKEADEFGDEVKNASDDAEKSSKSIQNIGTAVKGMVVTVGAATVAAGAALAGFTKKFLDLAESTREYREDQAKLDTAFTTAGFTAEQAGNAYTDFYSILGEEDRSVEAVNHLAKLCKSEQQLSQWTDIAAGVWATFGDSLPIEGLTEASNETAKTGKLTGVLDDALNWAGISEDDFQSSLDGCNSEQERAALITDTLNGLYKDAAKNYETLNSDVIESRKAQARLTDAYAKLGAVAEPIMTSLKNMAADVLEEMLPFVELMGEGLQGVLNGTADASSKLAEGVVGLTKTLMDKISQILPVVILAITESLPELLTAGTDMIITIVNGIALALPQLTTSALNVVLTLINGLITSLPLLLESALQIVSTLATGISEALPTLIPAIVQVLTQIVTTLIENLPMILEAGLQLVTGLAQGILNALPILIAALPEIIGGIVTYFLESIPMIIDTGITLLTSLVAALPDIITAIVAAIPEIINNIVDAFINSIPQIIDAGFRLLVSLIQNLPQIIVTVVGAIPQIISGLVSAILGNVGKIASTGVELFVSIIKNLPQIIAGIVKAVPQIITGIVNAFKDQMFRIVDIGGNIVKGLWDGITGLGDWLWDKVSGWASSIWDGICSFFGIHSPSKLMAWVGEMLVKGLAGSIDSKGNLAVKATENLSRDISGVMNGLSRDMQFSLSPDYRIRGNISSPYNIANDLPEDAQVVVVQNIYAKDTSYFGQQQEAARQMSLVTRGLAF